jgi:hypothetical protein
VASALIAVCSGGTIFALCAIAPTLMAAAREKEKIRRRFMAPSAVDESIRYND